MPYESAVRTIESGGGNGTGLLPRSGGYDKSSGGLKIELFNIIVAATILVLLAPLFIFITLLILIREGRPVFYRGERLGKSKNPFIMYKFRTLAPDAESKIQGDTIGRRTDLITPTGKFLRDTRLDELPQLWNVLRRDMNLVGPRPVRRAVYESMCLDIPGYDKRFAARPGVIGFSQLFTPHCSPKKLRSHIDNILLHRQQSLRWSVQALMLTAWFMSKRFFLDIVKLLSENILRQRVLRRYREKRRFDRVCQKQAVVLFRGEGCRDKKTLGEIVDINPEALRLRMGSRTMAMLPKQLILQVETRKLGRKGRKTKHAGCNGHIYRQTKLDDGRHEYIIMYKAKTPLNDYFVHQYFLHESVG